MNAAALAVLVEMEGRTVCVTRSRVPDVDAVGAREVGAADDEVRHDVFVGPPRRESAAPVRGGGVRRADTSAEAAGDDIVLKMPVGTILIDAETEQVLYELLVPGEKVLIAKGGDGGYGNLHYKTSTNRAPRRADKGWPGEERWIWLRLKLIADIGLVGLPNAGKSTFLAANSNARPKIADYPFTTLTPGLGVVKVGNREFVMADIPGLIEGAHEGAGLGTRFLGHVERCRALLHLVDGTQDDVAAAYKTVRAELRAYGGNLARKKEIVALNKTDAMTEEDIEKKRAQLAKASRKTVHVISGVAGMGVQKLLGELMVLVEKQNQKAAA